MKKKIKPTTVASQPPKMKRGEHNWYLTIDLNKVLCSYTWVFDSSYGSLSGSTSASFDDKKNRDEEEN